MYDKEVKNFLVDILADNYTYTFQNFIDDTLKLSKEHQFEFELECLFLKKRIDTIESKYMLRTDYGKVHFDSVFILDKPKNYYDENEHQKLIKFLSRDSIFEMRNPFNRLTIENCVNTYLHHKMTKLPDLSGLNFISQNELNQIFNKNGGWSEFYQKYGKGYLTMTIPIFTEDSEYAYFEWSYHCGRLCGYGYTGLYKKQNGKWIPLKVHMSWMS